MDYDEITARLAEVMQILKGQHMAKDISDGCTEKEITDYRARFDALTKAMGCVMAIKMLKLKITPKAKDWSDEDDI